MAYELGKTVDELSHLSLQDIANWLGFFALREKRIDDQIRKARRKGS